MVAQTSREPERCQALRVEAVVVRSKSAAQEREALLLAEACHGVERQVAGNGALDGRQLSAQRIVLHERVEFTEQSKGGHVGERAPSKVAHRLALKEGSSWRLREQLEQIELALARRLRRNLHYELEHLTVTVDGDDVQAAAEQDMRGLRSVERGRLTSGEQGTHGLVSGE